MAGLSGATAAAPPVPLLEEGVEGAEGEETVTSCMRVPTALEAVRREAEVEDKLVSPIPPAALPPLPVEVPPPTPLAELMRMLLLMLEEMLVASAPVSTARLDVALAAVVSRSVKDTFFTVAELPERLLMALPTKLITLLVAAESWACTAGVRGAPPPPVPAEVAEVTLVIDAAMEEAWLRIALLAAAEAAAAEAAVDVPLPEPVVPLPVAPVLEPAPLLEAAVADAVTVTLGTVMGTPMV